VAAEVMRVALRYARLKIEAKGLELYDPKSISFSRDCIVQDDLCGNAYIADKGHQFAGLPLSNAQNMIFRAEIRSGLSTNLSCDAKTPAGREGSRFC
jgi:hypothetical protein